MNRILLILSLVILASCNHETPNASKESPPPPSYHGNDIGEIPFDAQTDNPEFSFCDSNRIYHSRGALRYEGGWKALEKEIRTGLNSKAIQSDYSGYIIIRFMMNCNQQTDRYRAETLDSKYVEQPAPKELVDTLVQLTRGLDKWQSGRSNKENLDCSKFINYKFNHGQLETIFH